MNEKKLYIRFGEIPTNEQSTRYFHNEPKEILCGVSVYDCYVDENGIPHIIIPTPINEDTICTLTWNISYSQRKCYLVSGDNVGIGTDNEPLIKMLK